MYYIEWYLFGFINGFVDRIRNWIEVKKKYWCLIFPWNFWILIDIERRIITRVIFKDFNPNKYV